MVGSAQKAPVASAALSALNLAVVRQVVFERAAEQISEKSKRSTEAVVQTAEKTRRRSEAVDVVIEQNEGRTSKHIDNTHEAQAKGETSTPDPEQHRGGAVDIHV
ncbi:MAG: hypothetical protein VW268_03090 [Rhodospirillaceae bacterium]